MKIVITAGGTSEKIDDVRTITNSSTGRLGYAVGTAFLQQYADELEAVYYLHGTRARHPEHEKVIPVEIGGVADLQRELGRILAEDRCSRTCYGCQRLHSKRSDDAGKDPRRRTGRWWGRSFRQ